MTLQDFVITPLYLMVIYLIAYFVRNIVADTNTKRYFIPALTVKIIGAIAVGLIYQFYYNGGDTFNYFNNSKHIWEAFKDSPSLGMSLILSNNQYTSANFQYASLMYFFHDTSSYFVVRVAGLFDIFTLHTYSATAVFFAVFSFSGLWAMYKGFCDLYKNLHFEFALAIFFVPSVFFWGSGILKDTLTLGALGWATYAAIRMFFHRKHPIIPHIFIFILACYAVYMIKIYILLCFFPALILWIFLSWRKKIPSAMLRILLTPIMITIAVVLGYYALIAVGEDNKRYSLKALGQTAEITANYLYYVSEKQGGSSYTLGDFDYSVTGMVKKLPLAINVTLFRPYLWEAKNPIMLLSALESLALLIFTIVILVKTKFLFALRKIDPTITFCLVFAISFAFAVGFSTYNFGSLVRYKIPLVPFYLIALFVLNYYSKSAKKLSTLDITE